MRTSAFDMVSKLCDTCCGLSTKESTYKKITSLIHPNRDHRIENEVAQPKIAISSTTFPTVRKSGPEIVIKSIFPDSKD